MNGTKPQTMPHEDEPVLLTVRDVARYLRISQRKVWDLINTASLKAYRVGALVRVRRDDLEEFVVSVPYSEGKGK